MGIFRCCCIVVWGLVYLGKMLIGLNTIVFWLDLFDNEIPIPGNRKSLEFFRWMCRYFLQKNVLFAS